MKHISILGLNRIYKGLGRDHNRWYNITNMCDLPLKKKKKPKQQKPHCSTHRTKPFKELPAYIILNFSPPSFSSRPFPSILGLSTPGNCPLCCLTQQVALGTHLIHQQHLLWRKVFPCLSSGHSSTFRLLFNDFPPTSCCVSIPFAVSVI